MFYKISLRKDPVFQKKSWLYVVPVVCVCGLLVVLVCLAHHEDVVTPSEGVGVDLDGVQVGVGVGALSLVGRAAIIVPDGEVLHTVRLLLKTLGLTTDALPSPVDPDVVSLNSEQKLKER